jgi:solute carrier family 39 (zinc transporter), member 1/2/3
VSLTGVKLLLAALILTAGWAGGALPILWLGGRPRRDWMSAANAFAAGLFLAIGLLHFLPQSAAGFSAHSIRYPLAPLLALLSFLVLLLLEHVLLPEAAHDVVHAHSGDGPHPGLAGDHPEPHDTRAPFSPYLLMLALSVHSLLAGIVLGAGRDLAAALLTFSAIAPHKTTEGLALGMALTGAVARRRALRLVTLFALATPLGIALGALAGSGLRPDAGILFDAVVGALAAGTFLYIGAFDLLQDEFLRPGRRWGKWVFAVVGVAVGALLAALL